MKFTNAQQREIDEGYKNGLTTDQVSFYSNPQYDNLQMKQIRLALQDGYDEKQMQSFLNPEVPWESMQHFRESLSNSNMIDEQEIFNIITNNKENASEMLIQKANDNGGYDNITALIVYND